MGVRATIIPGSTSAGMLRVSLHGSPALGQKITDAFATRAFWRPLLPTEKIFTTINFVSVVTDMKPAAAPQLYQTQPEMCCWYYNEDDPRSVVIGRDDIQCGQPAIAPNIATRLGTFLFVLMVPFLIIFFPFLPCRAM